MTTVFIVKTIYNGSQLGPRYEVLVDGEYYEVGRRTLQALQDGMTPEDLDLEPFEEEEEEEVSFDDHRGDRWWHWGRV